MVYYRIKKRCAIFLAVVLVMISVFDQGKLFINGTVPVAKAEYEPDYMILCTTDENIPLSSKLRDYTNMSTFQVNGGYSVRISVYFSDSNFSYSSESGYAGVFMPADTYLAITYSNGGTIYSKTLTNSLGRDEYLYDYAPGTYQAILRTTYNGKEYNITHTFTVLEDPSMETPTPYDTATLSPTPYRTTTPSPSPTVSASATPSVSPSASSSATPSITPSPSPSSTPSATPTSSAGTKEKQTIKVKNMKKAMGTGQFVYSPGGDIFTELTAASSKSSVASVDAFGTSLLVNIKKPGVTKVSLKAIENDDYSAANASFRITVVPQTPTGLKTTVKGRYMTVKWKKAKGAKHYKIKVTRVGEGRTTSSEKWFSANKFKLPVAKGKKYKIQVIAYYNKKYYSSWSKAITKKT